MGMLEKIKNKLKELQDSGVPLFFIKDPVTKSPSVSLTLLIVSFTLSILSLLNKFTKIVDGVDIDNTLELLIVCASLYFGRSLSKKVNNKE
jgi:ABC-type bacteriocin/lantibiotic exporter with double-glycine peptidase domain